MTRLDNEPIVDEFDDQDFINDAFVDDPDDDPDDDDDDDDDDDT